jgi:hypothetical protein
MHQFAIRIVLSIDERMRQDHFLFAPSVRIRTPATVTAQFKVKQVAIGCVDISAQLWSNES